MRWSAWLVAKLQVVGFVTGIAAGIFGLGGGLIFNPIFISIGLPPSVSSATGLYLVMYSSLAVTI